LFKSILIAIQPKCIRNNEYLFFRIAQLFILHEMKLSVNNKGRNNQGGRDKKLKYNKASAKTASFCGCLQNRAFKNTDGLKRRKKKSRINASCESYKNHENKYCCYCFEMKEG